MGRTEGVDGALMTACEVARHLIRTCESLREFEAFMFGSSLLGVGSDFDILIVGPSGEPLSRLKAELRHAGKELPLDVLYMLPQEAEETGFVTSEGCIALTQLADSKNADFCRADGCQPVEPNSESGQSLLNSIERIMSL